MSARGEAWPPLVIRELDFRKKNILRDGERLILILPLPGHDEKVICFPEKTGGTDFRRIQKPGLGGQMMFTTDRAIMLDEDDVPLESIPRSKFSAAVDQNDWVIRLGKSQIKLPRRYVIYPLEIIHKISDLKSSVVN